MIPMGSQGFQPPDGRDFGGGRGVIQVQEIVKEEVVAGMGCKSWECGGAVGERDDKEQAAGATGPVGWLPACWSNKEPPIG